MPAWKTTLLVVGTGRMERRWKLYRLEGLVTVSLRSGGASGREWADRAPAVGADWAHPNLMPAGAPCKLVSMTAKEDDDEGFMAKHLKVTAEFFYPERRTLTLRYEVRAFPGVSGLLTQLRLKGRPSPKGVPAAFAAGLEGSRTDYLPLAGKNLDRTAWGYYNDPNQRYLADTPLGREESLPPAASVNWASGLILSDAKGGVVMVKESNVVTRNGSKNGAGTGTGKFILGEEGVQNTGWALTERDLDADKFQWCWASWSLAYDGGRDEMELALKQFDRARFPSDHEREPKSFLCGWGYNRSPAEGRSYAEQDMVMRMIQGCKETGIDMLLIDDGWQTESRDRMEPGDHLWRPKPRCFPEGWAPVAAAAKAAGVKLGLWAKSQSIGPEDMKWNAQQLDLRQFKLDFAVLDTYPRLCATRDKARAFLKDTGFQTPLTWDITDGRIAYGYYWAREYASIHLFNRSHWGDSKGRNVYIPSTCLRDYWLLAGIKT